MMRATQKTYQGKGSGHYVNNATLGIAHGGGKEVFYGNDIILVLNNQEELVLYGANGILAVLESLSKRSVAKIEWR